MYQTFIIFQDSDAPLPTLYGNLNMPVIKIIVSGGAIFALCTRCVYMLKMIKRNDNPKNPV